MTDASVVGKAPVVVPFALTEGAEATTAVSVVGKERWRARGRRRGSGGLFGL